MKVIFTLLLISFQLFANAQSFSDYEQYQKSQMMIPTEDSVDPRSDNFVMYYIKSFFIKSFTVNTAYDAFTEIDFIEKSDDVFYSTHKYYYKLYIPKYKLLFVVNKLNNADLDKHLLFFLSILKKQ